MKRLTKDKKAVARYPVGPWLFVAELPALPCETDSGGVAFDAHDLEGLERHAAAWLIEHGGVSSESLRFLRKKAGLQMAELAALLDTNKETVSRWENGHVSFSRATWLTVAALAAEKLKIKRGMRAILEATQEKAEAGVVKVG